ncbi:receptor-recognizing protein [Morganella phage vB_Mm5]
MAIKGPWVGSSAKSETGQSWMIAAGSVIKLYPTFWMSGMVGKSKDINVYIGSSDHNYNQSKLVNAVTAVMPQNQWSGVGLNLYINSGVQLVSDSNGSPCLNLAALSAFSKITLINSGTILGRGGIGASGGKGAGGGNGVIPDAGSAGGPAISIGSANNWKVWIDNRGVIGGGGGGGGSAIATAGGGGAPFGLKGNNAFGDAATSATYNAAGSGGRAGDNRGGAGGWYGAAGASGSGNLVQPGNPAGAAIAYNGGNVTYINAGTMYGSR